MLTKAYEGALSSGSSKEKQALTGWKDEQKIAALPKILSEAPVLPALQRYNGVGFQYLDTKTLTVSQYEYLASHLIIFSNLLGPIRGGDMIPEIKLKQRVKFADVAMAKYYREHTSGALDRIIGDDHVLDLRAEIYKNYYTPKATVTECIFLQNGKRINHWSKAYRGLLLRFVSRDQPTSIEELLRMKTPGLKLLSHSKAGGLSVITYEADKP
ncbi:peroxide stress protein YaaA [Candidatus Uhrbacteria bacterium]|nr:peroxide stress protein YaaA [Candidatus Uhrbacteria bacterium]